MGVTIFAALHIYNLEMKKTSKLQTSKVLPMSPRTLKTPLMLQEENVRLPTCHVCLTVYLYLQFDNVLWVPLTWNKEKEDEDAPKKPPSTSGSYSKRTEQVVNLQHVPNKY